MGSPTTSSLVVHDEETTITGYRNKQADRRNAEYANRHGITISNLIRMLLVREVASPKNSVSI
jgi:hypothetical protein